MRQRLRRPGTSRRLLGLALTLFLLAAACAGADESTGETTGAASPSVSDTEEAATTSSADVAAATTTTSSSGTTERVAEATVTIGDDTYQFRGEGLRGVTCLSDNFGWFVADIPLVDENGEPVYQPGDRSSEFDLNLRNESTVVNHIDDSGKSQKVEVYFGHLRDDPNWVPGYVVGWVANAELVEGRGLDTAASQVETYTIDGNTVSGTATFMTWESWNDFQRGNADTVESVEGSFTVNCRVE